LPDALDLRPADLLYLILGRVVIFLEFPLIGPGDSPDRLGSPDPQGSGAGT